MTTEFNFCSLKSKDDILNFSMMLCKMLNVYYINIYTTNDILCIYKSNNDWLIISNGKEIKYHEY